MFHNPLVTDDKNPCTTDGCNPITGIFHTPVNTDDGNACTDDACNSITGFINHVPVNITDNDACTEDACDPVTGAITHTVINTQDNNVCTTDGCNSVTGVFHNQINSSDNNLCTIDGCDPVNGPYHIPVDVNDDNVCTIDVCNTSTGVISHTAVNTNDGNVCTTDGCDKVTGIFHTPISVDDNNACTNDGCDVISGVYHNPVNTNDGNPCTTDACNTSTGVISHTDASPTITSTPGTIACYGGTTCVSVSATGGTSPYNGTGLFCGYGMGTYAFDVSDFKGCIVSKTVTISEPSKLTVTTSTTPAGCAINNGTATASPVGGTPGYTYEWTSGGQITNPATGLAPGSYIVKVTDANGCTASSTAIVGSTGSAPPTPGPISGPADACKKQSGVVYCVTPVPGATSYVWTLPAGASVVGSSDGSCITVKFSSKFIGGFICVKALNPCGSSNNICMNIVLITAAPTIPATISGPATLCPLASGNYTASSVINATSYIWSATGGLIISSGQGTISVVVSAPAGFAGGSVKVKATNCKGISGIKTKNVALGIGCRIAANAIAVDKLVDANDALSAFNAYPNPTSGKLTITFNSDRNAKYSLKVVNMIGSLMIDESISAIEGYNMKEINLENVAKGLYFISIQAEGTEAKTLRIIVE